MLGTTYKICIILSCMRRMQCTKILSFVIRYIAYRNRCRAHTITLSYFVHPFRTLPFAVHSCSVARVRTPTTISFTCTLRRSRHGGWRFLFSWKKNTFSFHEIIDKKSNDNSSKSKNRRHTNKIFQNENNTKDWQSTASS